MRKDLKKNMGKRIAAAVLAAALVAGSCPGGMTSYASKEQQTPVMAEIYVSPSGSDTGSGLATDPLRTLEQAREKVRTMNQDMTGDILVYFDDGEYFMESTAAFEAEDSGTNGFRVIYRAKEGSRPVFTSGKEVTGWKDAKDGQRPGLMKAEVPDVENTRQLYVDGELAIRARGQVPGGIERAGEYEEYTTYSGTHRAYRGYKSSAVEMAYWRNLQDVEFVYDILWVHRISPIASIEKVSDSEIYIEMDWKSFRLNQIAGGNQVHADVPSYIENAYELLDEPGEWYFDEKVKTVYYLPGEDQDMDQAEVIIPSTEQFITLYGEADKKVKNISFEGLSFEYNTWLYPSVHGWPDQQANFAHDPEETENMHGYSLIPQAAIETKMSENITFQSCDFHNLGSGAIGILKGSVNNVVEQCVFQDISGGGVLIGGVNINDAHPVTLAEDATLDEIKDAMEKHAEDPEKYPHDDRYIVKDNVVTNCYFNEIGTEYKGSVAVLAGYTDGTVITHNTIKNVAYSGISVGWGWGFWDQTGRASSTEAGEITPEWYPVFPQGDAAVSRNNIIEYNDVGYCMTKMHDGGGIYTLGDMPGSSISFNSIHNMSSWPGGLYLDEGSGGMKVEGNITYDTPYTCFYNIREFTWGHRMDQPVFMENYWDTAPESTAYPHELAEQIGIEKAYEHIRPKELDKVTAPDFVKTGDKVTLEGYFGEEPGRIVLTGPGGEVVVNGESPCLLSWTKHRISFLVPGGVSSGSFYVEAADGTRTNKDKKLTVYGSEKELFADDFESYSEGKLNEQQEAVEKYTFLHDRICVEQEDGGKILRMNSDGNDIYLTKEADWENVKISFDYRFDSDTKDYGGIYISPRYQNKDNRYLANLLPHFRNGIFYQRYLNGGYSEHGDTNFTYEVGAWYTIKMEMTGDNLQVKMWKRGEEEPAGWPGGASYGGLQKGGFFLQYADSSGADTAFASFDNLAVTTFQEGVTEDLSADQTAPLTQAQMTGEQTEQGAYINQAAIALEAEDGESGVAGIFWQLNDGPVNEYEKPVVVSRDGAFTLTYYACDRAGNREAAKKVTGTVAQGKVLFEENFDEYEEGKFTDPNEVGYELTHPEQFEVVKGDGIPGQVLKIQGKRDTAVRMIKPDSWDGTVMTLDFWYQEDLGGIEGLYVSNYYQSFSPDNMHVYPVVPGYGGILLQQNVNGNAREAARLENKRISLKAGHWYHLKAYTSGSEMAVKVWPKGSEEPQEWMAAGEVSGLQGGGGLHLSFSAGGNENNYALYDNIRIIDFTEAEPLEEADTSALQAKLEEMKKVDLTQYTGESAQRLVAAMEAAQKLLDRDDLTILDQEQIQAAVEELQAGFLELEEKEPETEPNPVPDTEPQTTCQVIFQDYNGSVLSQQKVEKNTSAKAPAVPARMGYTFTGWSSSFEKVTQNMVITARYQANTYRISFHKNGGRGSMGTQSMTYDQSSRLRAGKFKRSGYIFKGWSTQKNGKGTLYTNQKPVKNLTYVNGKTVTLYAQWKKVVRPGKVKTVSAASKKARTCTVAVTNVKRADGYQISYSFNMSFKKAKNVYVTKADGKKTTKLLKGLKRKKTCYIKVRAYTKDSAGKRYYAKAFSKVKRVKVK